MSISSHLAFITDDNEINLKVAGALLKRLGWSVETFDNARAMLQRLEDVQPASILLDISMPDMGGESACAHIRAYWRNSGVSTSSSNAASFTSRNWRR